MEPIFENRYRVTQAMLQEFMRKITIRIKSSLLAGMTGLLIVVAAYGLSGDIWEYLVPLVVCALFILALPTIMAWQSIRVGKIQNDGVMPETVVTFGDVIEVREGMVHLTVEYRKIVKVVRLKNSYVLLNGKNTGIMLREDGFTKGNFAEFRDFLGERCPTLSIPE